MLRIIQSIPSKKAEPIKQWLSEVGADILRDKAVEDTAQNKTFPTFAKISVMQGAIVNGYQLKYLLGEGGMAEVWYAENSIGKPAAVKILFEKLTRHESIVERFHNEALVMQKLDHPNIRKVYDYGYLGNRHCIIMEYLEGNDLEALMRNGRRFTDDELRRWWNQITDALNVTHAQGIVHRDIKPSNLFLDKYGNIKLLDFGIAKIMEDASLTHTGTVIGTTLYMSPEQIKTPKAVNYKTDAYSLAVSFVHLLSGRKPYDDTLLSNYEIQHSIITAPLDMGAVPTTWRYFLMPYLRKEASQRPALKHFEAVAAPRQSQNTSSRPTSHSRSPKGNSKGKTGLWIALGVAAAAIVTLVVVLIQPKQDTPYVEPIVQPIQNPSNNAPQEAAPTETPAAQQKPAVKEEEPPKKEEKQYYISRRGIPDLGIYLGESFPSVSSLSDEFSCVLERDVPSACIGVSRLTLKQNNKVCVICEEVEGFDGSRSVDAIEILSPSFYSDNGRPGEKVSSVMNKGNFDVFVSGDDIILWGNGLTYFVDKKYVNVDDDELFFGDDPVSEYFTGKYGAMKAKNIEFKSNAIIKRIINGGYCH